MGERVSETAGGEGRELRVTWIQMERTSFLVNIK